MSGAILLACGMVDKRDVEKLQKDAEAAGRVCHYLVVFKRFVCVCCVC